MNWIDEARLIWDRVFKHLDIEDQLQEEDILPSNNIHIKIYPKQDHYKSRMERYPYHVVLDTGNQLPYPLMAKKIFSELQDIGLIPYNQILAKSKTNAVTISNDKLPLKDLKLDTPLIFESENGAIIQIRKFHVVEKMTSNFNFGKHHFTQLGVQWRLGDHYVYIKGIEVPLINPRKKINDFNKFND